MNGWFALKRGEEHIKVFVIDLYMDRVLFTRVGGDGTLLTQSVIEFNKTYRWSGLNV